MKIQIIGDCCSACHHTHEAIEKAADSDTIVLLADCETAGINLNKDLSIDGGESKYTVTFKDYDGTVLKTESV